MWLFSISCFVIMLLSEGSLFHFLKSRMAFLQQSCLKVSLFEPQIQSLWQALVCGAPLESGGFWSNSLRASGLIHIFVVSGSHFLVLQFIMGHFKFPHWLQSPLLWGFNALSGFSAPGTRACLSLHTQKIFRMRPDQNLWALGLLCLALEPNWILSLSFWLSWLASLVLVLTPRDPFRIVQNILFYSVWGLLGFQLSLWSLPLNIIIAPLIGWWLFPLALFCLIPMLQPLFVVSLHGLEVMLRALDLAGRPLGFSVTLQELSFLVMSLHGALQLYRLEIKGRRIR